MTARAQIGTDVLAGTLVAGPVFTTLWGVGSMNQGYGAASPLGPALAIAFTIAIPFGAVFAIVPVLLGTTFLGWLGAHNEAMRLPVCWGLTGAAAAGLPTWLMSGGPEATPVFAATGAICALFARWQVRWVEGELAPRYGRA